MELTLSEDQKALQDAFGDLFGKESTPARVRAAEPDGHDEELWRTIAAAGVPLMAVAGEGDATLADVALVVKEAGRRLAPVPVVEAVVAARLLARFAPEFLPAIGTGEVLPTLALRPPVDGVARLVPAGAVADAILVLDADELILLRRDGVRPHVPVPPNLGGSPLADVPVAGQRRVLATGPDAVAAHQQAVTEWKLLTAAVLDGLREEALRLGVEYVKQRHAFGVPLGWFQSVAHRLADLATAGEGGFLLVSEAAWALDTGRPRASALTSMAFLHVAEVAFQTARASLQFHGGYGYTLEYDIQLYLRRAKAWPLVLGPRREEYRRLATAAFGATSEQAGGAA
jgi:alkylation response protein AidB-like acyl-CoA dehydrogenase